jgi:hypothetical protein
MFIKINPSLETCGVTVRTIPMGTFSVATAAPAAEEPLPVAIFVELGSSIRKILSLLIVEAWLFSVTTEGREMIFMLPSFSAASNALARFLNPPREFWITETVAPNPPGTLGKLEVFPWNGAFAGLAELKVVPPN